MSPRWIPMGLLALGAMAGTAFDPLADATPGHLGVQRGNYHVLEADFHAHTRFSDGFLSPIGLVRQARRRGLDVLSITEHNLVFPGEIGKAWSDITSGPMIIPGEEVTSGRYHVIAVGMHSRVLPSSSLDDVLAQIHAQGAVAIAAHPVKQFWPALVPSRAHFDGAELMHPIALSPPRGPGWRWDEMRTFYDEAAAEHHPLAAIGSSDYHFFSILGICRTYVFVDKPGPEAVIEAIRDRRTVVKQADGKLEGRADMVALLSESPIPDVDHDFSYHGTGWPDRITRIIGWIGLLGLWTVKRK